MGILNRTMDVSEQKEVYSQVFASGGVGGSMIAGIGSTLQLAPLPSPGTLQAAIVSCQGASVAATSSLEIFRFIPGAGVTTISGLGASFTIPAMGVSGYLSVSLVAAGSTLLNLLAGDQVQMRTGANTCVLPSLSIVVKKTQDIVARFGSST